MGAIRLGVDTNLVLALRDHFKLRLFLELGTYKAGTALWAAEHFERVITIEGYRPRFEKTYAANKDKFANLQFVFGDTRTTLPGILAEINEPVLIWADSHWCGEGAQDSHERGDECPLMIELETINAHPYAAQHVILVDDARLFTAPPPYPHDPAQWPDIEEVKNELKKFPRYIVIQDDVIVAVPRAPGIITIPYLS
jgi:hypothetical protein